MVSPITSKTEMEMALTIPLPVNPTGRRPTAVSAERLGSKYSRRSNDPTDFTLEPITVMRTPFLRRNLLCGILLLALCIAASIGFAQRSEVRKPSQCLRIFQEFKKKMEGLTVTP